MCNSDHSFTAPYADLDIMNGSGYFYNGLAWYTDKDKEMKAHERRISTRVPAQFKVNFIHEGDYLISHTRDISIDGMFIYTENPPPVKEQTNLTFSIGDLHDVSMLAEVVWVNHTHSKKDSGMAVKFIDPQQDLIDAILDIIHKVAIFPEQ